MTAFVQGVKSPTSPHFRQSVALSNGNNLPLGQADIGKAVKLVADSTYGLCEENDEIEGFIISIEPHTVTPAAGWGSCGFGTIQTGERFIAKNVSGSALAIGDYVVSGEQPARGTAITRVTSGSLNGCYPLPVNKAPAIDPEDTVVPNFRWRVISFLGSNGANNSHVLVERI